MPAALIQEAVQYYHDLLTEHHLANTQELLASQMEQLSVGDRPTCTVLRPCFVDEDTYAFICRASTRVLRAISILGDRLRSDAALRCELNLTPEEEEIVQIDTGYGAPDVSARLDGFLSSEGAFHFVEYNADSPGGLGYGDALAELFASMPILEAFRKRYDVRLIPVRSHVFESLVAAYHRWGGKGLPKIAIVDWRGTSTYNEFVLFQQHFESRGCKVRIADPDELEYRSGHLFIENFRVDLIYKRVIVGELLQKFGLKHPIIDAVRARSVCMINGFGVQMLFKKIAFALLSDPAYQHFFEPEVASALAAHIPWTRRVREYRTDYHGTIIDLVSYVAENRERFVLKPNGEYGGKGVVLGWECEAIRWTEALQAALAHSFVVQERVPLGREPYPSVVDGQLRFEERYFDLDPYVWDGSRVEGCGVRLSKLALLNVSAGSGSATPLFIINPAQRK